MLIGELLLEINYLKEKEGFTDKDKIKITNFKEDFDIQCVTTQSDILMNLTDEEGESEIILIDNRSKKYFLINGVELSRDLITDDKTLIINISEE